MKTKLKKNAFFFYKIWFWYAFSLLAPLFVTKNLISFSDSVKLKGLRINTLFRPQLLPSAAGASHIHAEWLASVRQYKLTQKLSLCSL